MRTKLLNEIMTIAEQKAKELKGDFFIIEYVYLAMVEVSKNTAILSNEEIDTRELEELRKKIQETNLPEASVLKNQIQEKEFTEEDRQHARAFTIWMSMAKRSAYDALNHIVSSGWLKDKLPESTTEKAASIQKAAIKAPANTAAKPEKQSAEPAKTAETTGTAATTDSSEDSVEALIQKTMKLRTSLLDNVIGQNYAVKGFVEGFFQGELIAGMDASRKGPRSIFLFAGSPGVGKTFLAEQAAATLGLDTKRLDMSSYSGIMAVDELTGIPKNYAAPKQGELTGFVHEHPRSIIIFDEIEKSYEKVINLFLQILDVGHLYDNFLEKNVSFLDTIIIFTTNAGKQLYKDSLQHDLSATPRKVILDALGKDINPLTGHPFFPEAICSRFATGNVLMFNHLSASDLMQITSKELLRQQENFEKKFGIVSKECENMAPTILFSLGGHCDARSVVAAAKKFFVSEVFELFRLAEARHNTNLAGKIKEIIWKIDLDNAPEQVSQLYEENDDNTILIFGHPQNNALSTISLKGNRILYTSSLEKAHEILRKNEISMAIIDYYYGVTDKDKKYLNAEDIHSDGKALFTEIRNEYPELPVYIWETADYAYNHEEEISFLGKGARKILRLSAGQLAQAQHELSDLSLALCYQRGMSTLALKHQVLAYETSQSVQNNGTCGEIRIFDQHLTVAVEAEDQKAILSAEEKPNKHWEDIIVSNDVQKELEYFIGYLKNPKSFLAKGARAPKGILLYGPPGTGKTSLAKVMATESDVTFLSASADQFFSRWAGEGPESVHRIFATARKYAPAILFIDEIDAIGRARTESGSSDGRQEILNALLTEMDGFKSAVKKPVFVMAATNLGGNHGDTHGMDGALVRRFDRSIIVDLPDKEGRLKLFRLLKSKNPLLEISEEEMNSLADRSIGMSPALIESAVESAVRDAIRSECTVTDEIMDEAFETFNSGAEKKWDPRELMRTARHEAGHAFICNYYGEKPAYLTIVARDSHGGYMMHGNTEQKGSYTKDDLLHRICVSMAGRAAEIVYYGDRDGITTGPSGDLDSASRIARAMICAYGMYGDITLGTIPSNSSDASELANRINTCVNTILNEQLKEAVHLIRENQKKMDDLVDALMEKTHLNEEQIQQILG